MNIKKFADKYRNEQKVNISELKKGTTIFLITEHSKYTLELIDPKMAKVIARGGYFKERKKEPCETYVIGSTSGGSLLFRHMLVEGLYCEFDNTVITSVIKKIYINYSN